MAEVELLQQVGLNKYEAEAYSTLLLQGPLTGYELGKRSAVPLSRSYEILERLINKGLALVQPGDPPRYAAADPELFLDRVRTQMTQTLTALAEALTSQPRTDASGEFWVIRGRRHILERATAMIAGAQHTLELSLPTQQDPDMLHLQAAVHDQDQRLRQTRLSFSGSAEEPILLLLVDGREALAGTLTPPEQCQAVVSANPALVALFKHAFSRVSSDEQPAPAASSRTARPVEHLNWLAWEESKQRRLWQAHIENRIA